jgi:hypothetical protein
MRLRDRQLLIDSVRSAISHSSINDRLIRQFGRCRPGHVEQAALACQAFRHDAGTSLRRSRSRNHPRLTGQPWVKPGGDKKTTKGQDFVGLASLA